MKTDSKFASELIQGWELLKLELAYTPKRNIYIAGAISIFTLLICIPSKLIPGFTDEANGSQLAWLFILPAMMGYGPPMAFRESRYKTLMALPITLNVVFWIRYLNLILFLMPWMVITLFWMLYLSKWGYPFSWIAYLNIASLILIMTTLTTVFKLPAYKPSDFSAAYKNMLPQYFIIWPLGFIVGGVIDIAGDYSIFNELWLSPLLFGSVYLFARLGIRATRMSIVG